MSKAWLSENDSPGSTTAVLLGPVEELDLISQCAKHPDGILWIMTEGEGKVPESLPTNLQPIIVAPDGSGFPEEEFQRFLGLNYKVIPSIRVSALISPSNKAYVEILDLVMRQADATLRARRTRSENGLLKQRNVFANLSGYLMRRVPESWQGLAAGTTALVVGAGPSLDKTLPLLKKGFGHPLIIAADSTLEALRRHDMSPDFVINVDPEKSTQTCGYLGDNPGIAVLSSHSHPSWRTAWGEKTRYLSGRVLTEDWLAENGVPKTTTQAVNNAGLTSILLADFLGVEVIIMVGMDLAGGAGGEPRYAESTGRSSMTIEASQEHRIPGNFEEAVSTPFLSDWSETSKQCAAMAKHRYLINLNDRGAKLEGTLLIHPEKIVELRETLAEHLQTQSKRNEILDGLHQEEDPNPRLEQLIELLAARCDDIRSQLDPLLAAGKDASTESKVGLLGKILGDPNFATLLGDYAFAVIPGILPNMKPDDSQLTQWLLELRTTLWLLEDALLETEPSEECLVRFLAPRSS